MEASDGEEALRIVKERRPQVVISDILMPTVDGFELVVDDEEQNRVILTRLLEARSAESWRGASGRSVCLQ